MGWCGSREVREGDGGVLGGPDGAACTEPGNTGGRGGGVLGYSKEELHHLVPAGILGTVGTFHLPKMPKKRRLIQTLSGPVTQPAMYRNKAGVRGIIGKH